MSPLLNKRFRSAPIGSHGPLPPATPSVFYCICNICTFLVPPVQLPLRASSLTSSPKGWYASSQLPIPPVAPSLRGRPFLTVGCTAAIALPGEAPPQSLVFVAQPSPPPAMPVWFLPQPSLGRERGFVVVLPTGQFGTPPSIVVPGDSPLGLALQFPG